MDGPLVRYVEEESKWNYIPNITQNFHLWVSWNFFFILQPNIWRFVTSIYKCSMDWNLLSWHKKISKIHFFIFGISQSFFHIYNTFLRENPWKVFDPSITFILQISTMYLLKSFSVSLWNFFKTLLGCPFGDICLQPVSYNSA